MNIIFDALPAAIGNVRAGKLKILALTGKTRHPNFPDIPTFAEAGLPGLVAVNWWGVFLPAGTPKPVVDAYYSALVKIMANPDLKERFAGLGVEAMATTQDEFKTFLADEKSKYAKLIADNNIKAE